VSLESWLVSNPGVQLISRDRSGDDATGASKGAPEAVQVADRFHVQKNLSEAVERIFHRRRHLLHQIVVARPASYSAPVSVPIPREDAGSESTADPQQTDAPV